MSSPQRRAERAREQAAADGAHAQAEYERSQMSWWMLIEDAEYIHDLKRILQEMAEHLPERGS